MRLRQEHDLLPRAKVLGIALSLVGATALGVTSAWLLESCRHAELGHRPVTGNAELEPPNEVGAMEMELFDLRGKPPPPGTGGPKLDTYGWVDREAGIVSIPLDRAFDLYLAQEAEEAP